MKRFLIPRLLPGLLALLALAGCTGTQEESIPIMLVVGSVEPGGPQLQLIEDVRDPPPRDLVPVPGSVQPLPAAPVSVDVVERNGERSELVVLDESGMLHFFDLSDLPASFAPTRAALDVATLIPADQAVGTAFCWQQVQVGGEQTNPGRYAALLDSCSPDLSEVYVIDLATDQFLYALTVQHVDAQPLLPIGIHVDQASERLYFATDEFTRTLVQSVPIADADAVPEELGTAEIDPLETIDLAPLGNGVGLLGEDLLAVVPFDGAAASPVEVDLVDPERLLPDPTGNVELLVALADERGSILASLEDLDQEALFLQEPLADATLEPVQRFAYLLEAGGIEILDLFPYADPPSNRLLFVDLTGLDDPRVITWAFGTQAP